MAATSHRGRPAHRPDHRLPGHGPGRLRPGRPRQRPVAERDRAEGSPQAGLRPRPPGPDRGVPGGLEGSRVRGRPRPRRQLRHRLQHGELRPHGHPHGREHRRRPLADADQRGVPPAADDRHSRPFAIWASSASATSSTPSTRGRATTGSSRSTPGFRAAPPWPPRPPATRWPSSPPSSSWATACPTCSTPSPRRPRPASSRPWTTWWSRSRAGT